MQEYIQFYMTICSPVTINIVTIATSVHKLRSHLPQPSYSAYQTDTIHQPLHLNMQIVYHPYPHPGICIYSFLRERINNCLHAQTPSLSHRRKPAAIARYPIGNAQVYSLQKLHMQILRPATKSSLHATHTHWKNSHTNISCKPRKIIATKKISLRRVPRYPNK